MHSQHSKPLIIVFLAGSVLVLLHAGLAWISGDFDYDISLVQKPVLTLVVLELLAGSVFLAAAFSALRLEDSKALLVWVIVIGTILRGLMLASTPMLEDDYYRYLWDGAVLAKGFNPFSYAPQQVLSEPEGVPQELVELARQSGGSIARINHPHLRTIYPPVAQAVFAFSNWLGPWSMTVWRLVLSIFDAGALLLLLGVLRSLKLPSMLALIYWWNPLVLKEVFNSGHMDVIAVPPALAAIWWASRGRSVTAAAALAVATASKLWPLGLFPVILSPSLGNMKRLVGSGSVFLLMVTALFVPVFVSGFGSDSGFTAYGSRWEINDSLFRVFHWGVESALTLVSVDSHTAFLATRILVVLGVLLWILALTVRVPAEASHLWERSLLVIAGMFLVSPAQFPWYCLWFIPFLAVRPRPSLLLLGALMPLYYLRYYFLARGDETVFTNYIVWLEYVPVWTVLIWEWATGWGKILPAVQERHGS